MRNVIIVLALAVLIPTFSFAADTAATPTKPPLAMTPAPAQGTSSVPGTPPAPVTNAPVTYTSHLITDAPLPDDYMMGKTKAPITMIEYVSMSCPHCARFSNTTMVDLQKKYIDTGKMRYIMRQYPLNEPALKGAMLLDCVGQQDKKKYFVFAKVLFDAQDKWAFDANYMSGLETIATVGGLSKEQFEQCVNNTDREMRVLKAKKVATDELHIPHTPIIVINGTSYEGDRSIEGMSKFLDAKLNSPRK